MLRNLVLCLFGAFLWTVNLTAADVPPALNTSCDGGMVTDATGEDTVQVCINGTPQVVAFASTGASGGTFTYVITDATGKILGLPPGNSIDFAPAGIGECWVWGLSYTGNLTAQAGDNALTTMLSDSCFDLSDNFLVVFRDSVSGGMVTTASGMTSYTVCIDGNSQVVSFANSGNLGPNFRYVVTDDQNKILGLPPGNMVDFGGAGPGICRVWGLSYTGNVTAMMGDDAAAVALSDGCFDLSDNFVEIIRDSVSGGMVTTASGMTSYTVCIDGNSQVVSFANSGNVGPNFRYVVTDDQNKILGLPPGNMVDFGGAGPGICRVWGLSYTGNVTAMMGDDAAAVALSDGCFDLSDNFVEIIRDSVSGGMVTTASGMTSYTVCIDGNSQVVSFANSGNVGPNFRYVVTDDQNKILGLPPGNMVDFGGAGPGICRVWGLSYTGNVTAMMGDDAAAVSLSDGCFDLSDNFVEIIRDSVSGGMVTTAGGMTSYTVCIDGNSQVVSFAHSGNLGPNFRYVVTDDQNKILGLPPGNMVDFGGAGPGICRVWGLSYTGNVTAMMGDDAAAVSLSDGCFDLSDNFVEIIRDSVSGGMVTTAGGMTSYTVCIDGNSQVVSFAHSGNLGPNFRYVVTDDQNKILGLPPGNMVDFGGAGPGICRVWGLSYTGNVTAMMGDDAAAVALSDGCFDLSDNFVEIIRDSVSGGMVTTASGMTSYTVCIDGNSQVVSFANSGNLGPNFRYVVTDDQNKILGLPPGNMVDFGGAGPGICRVWGLSYTGNVTAMMGDDAAAVALSDGCFDLSDNFVEIIRDSVSGGYVTTTGGEDTTYVCINGLSQTVSFASQGAVGPNFTYVITDDTGKILGIPPGSSLDFAPAGLGECWVWGLSYTGNITAQPGDNALQVPLTDGCFDLSDNFLVVFRDNILPDAGTLTADAPSFPLGSDGSVFASASPDGNAVVLPGFSVAYVLTGGSQLSLKQISTRSSFRIKRAGTFKIHTLVYSNDPGSANYLDLSFVDFSKPTRAAEVLAEIASQGVCADLDAAGTTVVVTEAGTPPPPPPSPVCTADAGTLSANPPTYTLQNGSVFISAQPNGDAVVPAGYVVRYVLTGGSRLSLKQISTRPTFRIRRVGTFRIHTLVFNPDPASPDYLDLSFVDFSKPTRGADVLAEIASQGACADLDVAGVQVSVVNPGGNRVPAMADIVIAPNPATTEVNITSEAANLVHFRLMDLKGQEVSRGTWDFAQNSRQEIRLTNLPAGIYQLMLQDDATGELTVEKIVKQ